MVLGLSEKALPPNDSAMQAFCASPPLPPLFHARPYGKLRVCVTLVTVTRTSAGYGPELGSSTETM